MDVDVDVVVDVIDPVIVAALVSGNDIVGVIGSLGRSGFRVFASNCAVVQLLITAWITPTTSFPFTSAATITGSITSTTTSTSTSTITEGSGPRSIWPRVTP